MFDPQKARAVVLGDRFAGSWHRIQSNGEQTPRSAGRATQHLIAGPFVSLRVHSAARERRARSTSLTYFSSKDIQAQSQAAEHPGAAGRSSQQGPRRPGQRGHRTKTNPEVGACAHNMLPGSVVGDSRYCAGWLISNIQPRSHRLAILRGVVVPRSAALYAGGIGLRTCALSGRTTRCFCCGGSASSLVVCDPQTIFRRSTGARMVAGDLSS